MLHEVGGSWIAVCKTPHHALNSAAPTDRSRTRTQAIGGAGTWGWPKSVKDRDDQRNATQCSAARRIETHCEGYARFGNWPDFLTCQARAANTDPAIARIPEPNKERGALAAPATDA